MLLIIVLVLFASQLTAQECNSIRIRKEFRDMTLLEFTKFKAALMVLRKTFDPDRLDVGFSLYDKFTQIHINASRVAHWTPQFLPWHRLFVLQMEDALRKIDSSITIPYWDWSYDAREPLKSPLLTSDYLLTELQGDCTLIASHPTWHCVTRNYDPDNFTSFVDSRSLDRLMRLNLDYDTFRRLLEATPHAIVHVALGGVGGDLTNMQSSFIDKIWYDWQKMHGKVDAYNGNHEGTPVTQNDILPPFNRPIKEAFNIEKLCYSYQPFSKRLVEGIEMPVPALTDITNGPFKMPMQIPEHWIRMHNVSLHEFRSFEKQIQSVMLDMNPDSKVSSSADQLSSSVTFIILTIVLFHMLRFY